LTRPVFKKFNRNFWLKKVQQQKLEKKLKIYEKWGFNIIRKAISLSTFWYNFYGTFILV
jgi:hypothetical protein